MDQVALKRLKKIKVLGTNLANFYKFVSLRLL